MKKRDSYLAFGVPDFTDAEVLAITNVLRSGWVGMGSETLAFEKELSSYLNTQHVVTVSSCTSALFLSLLALGIKEGDEVICPSLTWCATANAALYLKAIPVLCDVDRHTLCVTAETIQPLITPHTKAVIVVHFGGYAIDTKTLRKILPDNIAIIEDAAHAFGAVYPDDSKVGTSGNLTCFSFYANKNLSTGEGGAIALNNNAAADHIRKLRLSGMPVNAWNRFTDARGKIYSEIDELGYKMNYTDLQACIGRIQLQRQHEFHAKRLQISKIYKDMADRIGIAVQNNITHRGHSRHLFILTLPRRYLKISRDEFILELRELNIGAGLHYHPLHLMPLYKNYSRGPLPVTEDIHSRILTLPISASMSLDDANEVAEMVVSLIDKYKVNDYAKEK